MRLKVKKNAVKPSVEKPWETLPHDRKTILVEQFAKRRVKQKAYHGQKLMSVLQLVELVPITIRKIRCLNVKLNHGFSHSG